MSKFVEEEDKWNVQSFSLQEKSLSLPTVKLGQIGGGNKNNRITDLKQNGSNKQILFQNYGNEENNDKSYSNNNENDENLENLGENILPKSTFDLKLSKTNRKKEEINRYQDQINNRINLRLSNDKIVIDGKKQSKSQVPLIRNISGTKKSFYNQINEPKVDEISNINKILMSKKKEKNMKN